MSDVGMIPVTVCDLVGSSQPHYCRAPRGAARHLSGQRPCFTLKRPRHCASICFRKSHGTVAAAIAVASKQGTPGSTVQESLGNAKLQRQLEASYLARSAAEVDLSQPPATASDSELLSVQAYAQLERSWQTHQASTSGRSNVSDVPALLPGSKSGRRQNKRSRQRLSRLYTPPAYSSSADQPPANLQCPDAQVCAAIRQQLEEERGKQRISRSLAEADAVSMFLYDLGDASLLTRAQEGQLSQIYQKGTAQEDAIAQLAQQLDREPRESELVQHLGLSSFSEVVQIRNNAREAMQLMTSYNLRLVFSMCKKFSGRGVDVADLIPEGTAGMVKAIEKFDANKGFKFSTYAHWWIRQSLSRCIVNQSRVIRVPVHVHEVVAKINKVRTRLEEAPGRHSPPTHEEVGAEVGLPAAKVKMFLKQVEPARDLDGPAYTAGHSRIDPGEAAELIDVVAAEPLQPDEPVESKAKDSINTLLSTLLPRERNVIRMRYGLHDAKGTCMTFNDIGAAYGLSKERVRQIEDKALTKLRNPARRKLLQAAGH